MTCYSAIDFKPGDKVILSDTREIVEVFRIVGRRYLEYKRLDNEVGVCIPAHGDVEKIMKPAIIQEG